MASLSIIHIDILVVTVTFMFFVAVEVKDTLHKVLKEDSRLSNQKQVDQTELSKLAQLLVNKSANETKEERPFPLDVVFLE